MGVEGFGLGCSPLHSQSLLGIIIWGTMIPLKDCSTKRDHPKFWEFMSEGLEDLEGLEGFKGLGLRV